MTDQTNSARQALACLLVAACLTGCTESQADLDQYPRMLNETADARAQESIACNARGLLCARLVAMRGEACAQTANDNRLPAAQRQQRRDCAMADARRMPGLMPDDAPAADQDRAALLVFDAWRAARDGGAPAATSTAMKAAADSLAGMPGGKPYAETLEAENAVFGVLTGHGSKDADCATLGAARRQLPAAAPGSALADRLGTLATNIASAQTVRGCAR